MSLVSLSCPGQSSASRFPDPWKSRRVWRESFCAQHVDNNSGPQKFTDWAVSRAAKVPNNPLPKDLKMYCAAPTMDCIASGYTCSVFCNWTPDKVQVNHTHQCHCTICCVIWWGLLMIKDQLGVVLDKANFWIKNLQFAMDFLCTVILFLWLYFFRENFVKDIVKDSFRTIGIQSNNFRGHLYAPTFFLNETFSFCSWPIPQNEAVVNCIYHIHVH